MFKIYPYKAGSKSVKFLKEQLDAVVIKLKNSKYKPRPDHVIINWGNSNRPTWMTDDAHNLVLNTPETVAIAADKLATFTALSNAEVAHVPFTTSRDKAQEWLDLGHKVFVREKLSGHSGDGIKVFELEEHPNTARLAHVAQELDALGFDLIARRVEDEMIIDEKEIPLAPLYTRGIKNNGEYRVHVFKEDVILYQKKSRRVDEDGNIITADGAEADVRNLASNWVYRTGNLKRLERVENLALHAVAALGLDFGAVDIIMDEDGKVFVLEINSAPGLGNQDTLAAYANAFNNIKTNQP